MALFSFSGPTELRFGDVIVSVGFELGVLLLGPDAWFAKTNVDWSLGIFLFPVWIFCGLISACLFYRDHDDVAIDPCYFRSLWAVIGGVVCWPICLLFRPSVADIAFVFLTFGLGPVVGFHIYRYFAKRKKDKDMEDER